MSTKYKVTNSKERLQLICNELLYGVVKGRGNIIVNEEGYKELKRYSQEQFKVSMKKTNSELTDLNTALVWAVNTLIAFIENRGTGDLTPVLSCAEAEIKKGMEKPYLFRWDSKKVVPKIYIEDKKK